MSIQAYWKQKLNILFPILTSFLLFTAILFTSRLALMLWQSERIVDSPWWATMLLSGLRIDISSLCYLLILPSLLTVLFAGRSAFGRFWLYFFRLWVVAGLWLIVYMEMATPPFIIEYDVRPNRLFLEYLIYPKEVLSMLWTGYKLELAIGTLGSALTLYLGWGFSKKIVDNLHFPKWYWRPVLAIIVLAVGVMGARSTLQNRPMNPALVSFSTDPLINDLVLNSSYSMIFAAKGMASEENAFDYYPKMAEEKIISLVRESANMPATYNLNSTSPTLSYRQASFQGKPKNLVILLQESLGARYVGALGGLPLTPNLDQLINEGWSLDNLYATGTRSVRGIEAVTTGFFPTPSRSTVKLTKSQSNFFSIADVLKQNGYITQFIYGGESHFDNMKSFFLGNGFTDIQDLPTFDSPSFVGSWGASDEDLYDKAHQQFSMMQQQNKPFFSLVFTSSNHSPFEYPQGKIEPYNQPSATRENTAKYSDYALGKFFEKAKKSNYWQDTVFVVVADHDSRAYGNQLVPIDHFKIPAVFIGEGIDAKRDNRLASQIDLPTTMLSIIGIDAETPMLGFDLTQPIPKEKQRAMMQFNKNFAWMDANNNIVILQPDKAAKGFYYNPQDKSLTPQQQGIELEQIANANALWGSLAYTKGYYAPASQQQYVLNNTAETDTIKQTIDK
ncbi:LTA synthase family protein [Vibrio sp. MACH09]|uniref:LTA synthase family protein n=1 Tax=Vibrio sp. MACH09 TaxID=3025122 RepID=UPI00295E5296|nr:LTA synthase family protein [Vibrio sp. MACH09]